MPRVSVIIPTHNMANYIIQTVESVLAQTYEDYEIIVVDDGSTDNTRKVLTPYMGRIRYMWQENQERAVARNHGMRLAQGELVAFLDADDVWLSHYLKQQVAALDAHPQAILAYCLAQTIDDDGHPISFCGSDYLGGEPGAGIEARQHGPELLFGSPTILPSATLVRREAVDQAGPFDAQAVPLEDWEMWLRLARLGVFVHVPQVLIQYRVYSWERELRIRASDHHLARYAYVIEKTAAADPSGIPSSLRNQALSARYAQCALANYQLGDAIRGQQIMAQAVHLDPTLAWRTCVTALLEDQARRVWRDTGDETTVLAFLETTVANLPPGMQPPCGGAREVLSRVYMADAFMAHDAGEKKTAQQMLWRGVRNDPTWLLNRGVLSIAAHSLLNRIAAHI